MIDKNIKMKFYAGLLAGGVIGIAILSGWLLAVGRWVETGFAASFAQKAEIAKILKQDSLLLGVPRDLGIQRGTRQSDFGEASREFRSYFTIGGRVYFEKSQGSCGAGRSRCFGAGVLLL